MFPIFSMITTKEENDFVVRIFLEEYKRLYGIARNIIGNHEDAEDCVQDLIAIVSNNIERFMESDDEYLKRLLVISIRNIAINKYNKRKRRGKIMSLTRYNEDDWEEEGEIDIPDIDADVEKLVINEEFAALIHEIVNELNDIDKAIVQLSYFHGMSSIEIGKFLSMRPGTVRMKLTRAKAKLLELGGKRLNDYR